MASALRDIERRVTRTIPPTRTADFSLLNNTFLTPIDSVDTDHEAFLAQDGVFIARNTQA
jgi:hypothetical protein